MNETATKTTLIVRKQRTVEKIIEKRRKREKKKGKKWKEKERKERGDRRTVPNHRRKLKESLVDSYRSII